MKTSEKPVFVVNSNPDESARLSHLLEEAGCLAQTITSPLALKIAMRTRACMAVIIDIDAVAVDNRTLRDIASAFPAVPLMCLSGKRIHPELEDAIRDHVFACLNKPIDPDELDYWLKCIRTDDRGASVD